MKGKRIFYTEWAYVGGILLLALGTAFMERADFGVSMVVAPAYLLHRKISLALPAYTFGMSEYILQAFLLAVLTVVLRRFRITYLFSFVTAVIYGLTLDRCMALVGRLPSWSLGGRLAGYAVGMLLCAAGVSLLFHTYISPEVYELFVKEVAAKHSWDIPKVKTAYDCASCLIGIVLSFAFFGFGRFEGVKLGTVFCALVNGFLIGRCSRRLETWFEFRDALRLRPYFEG